MGLKDDLIAAKALIASKRRWRKGADTDRVPCCAVIAARRISGGNIVTEVRVVAALNEALPPGDYYYKSAPLRVGEFNDAENTTHADIMALYDRAIEAAS